MMQRTIPWQMFSGIREQISPTIRAVATLNYYFENQVITGPNAFVIKADDYSQFEAAIKRKLIREIGNQPVA